MALASSDWDCLLIAVELITHHVHEEHNILVSERFRHYSIALPKVKKAASVVLLTAIPPLFREFCVWFRRFLSFLLAGTTKIDTSKRENSPQVGEHQRSQYWRSRHGSRLNCSPVTECWKKHHQTILQNLTNPGLPAVSVFEDSTDSTPEWHTLSHLQPHKSIEKLSCHSHVSFFGAIESLECENSRKTQQSTQPKHILSWALRMCSSQRSLVEISISWPFWNRYFLQKKCQEENMSRTAQNMDHDNFHYPRHQS